MYPSLHTGPRAPTSVKLQEGHSVLVFCASKMLCEHAAKHIAKLLDIPDRAALAGPGADGDHFDRSWLTAELGRLPGAVEPAFHELLPKGVAYHHAGLTTEERELVEQGYSKGKGSDVIAWRIEEKDGCWDPNEVDW